LDEPTSALDDDRTRRFWVSVEKMTSGGVGVLAVTHDPHEVARYYQGNRQAVFMNAQGDISDAPHDMSLRTAQRATPVAR
jgi:ABC-type sugar transport system ATPase subunit